MKRDDFFNFNSFNFGRICNIAMHTRDTTVPWYCVIPSERL